MRIRQKSFSSSLSLSLSLALSTFFPASLSLSLSSFDQDNGQLYGHRLSAAHIRKQRGAHRHILFNFLVVVVVFVVAVVYH